MKKSNGPVTRLDGDALELPDWSGMDEGSNRVGLEEAFALCEEYARVFPAPRQRSDTDEKCSVEFVL